MSTYLGNASLSPAVKDRVLSTFQQALTLYKQGRLDEVEQGCGLILRMDPMFDPARKLMEKVRNPAAPIDVDSLLPSSPAGDPLGEARQALAARDFPRVLEITTEVLTNDLTNDDARVLNEQAREKMEAGPFIDQFIRKAEMFANGGNTAAARAELEKARGLDHDHPGIKKALQALTPAEPAAFSFDSSPSPSFVVDTPQPPPGRSTSQAADFGFTFEEEKPAAPPPALGGFSFDSAPSAPSPFSTETGTMPAVTPPAGFSFDQPAAAPSAPSPSGGGFSFNAPASPAAPPPPAPAGGFSFDSATPGPSGFSFDGAAPAAPPSAPGAFDFSTAPSDTSPDDQKKIQQYLSDGDRAFQSGDFQQAIDLWSRIFLIDVTNEEASQRIEQAKARRRDFEQKAESMLAAAVQAFDRNDLDGARTRFQDVLRVDPNNPTAQDYIARLNETPTEGGAVGRETPFIPPSRSDTPPDLFDDAQDGSYNSSMPPDPAAVTAPAKAKKIAAEKPVPAPRAEGRKSMGVIATIVGVVVVVAIGWFVWSKLMSKPRFDPAATRQIFSEATSLAEKGRYDQAIAMLQDVKPEDPQHDKALELIDDLQHKKSQASEMVDGRPAAKVYQEGLANGRTAFEAHDYDAAKKAFDSASRVKPLPPDMKALYDTASQQVAKLDSAKALFKEQKYQDAVTNLEGLGQNDPQNASVRRMITDAHFNLGAQALQSEHLQDAIREFDVVLKTDPNDELARRSKALAERYNDQTRDLLYKMYVKYLPLRSVS